MKNFVKPIVLSLAVICILGPIVGTMIIGALFGQPFTFFAHDLAGVPAVLYAYITILPVAIPVAFLVCLVCYVYATRFAKGRDFKFWRNDFVKMGTIFGIFAVFPILIRILAEFRDIFDLINFVRWIIAGAGSGILCSMLIFKAWYRSAAQIST